MVGIYKIINPKNEIYIGKSVNIEKRWKYHISSKGRCSPKLAISFYEHGFSAHKFEVVIECQEHELKDKEIYYINFYNSINSLNCYKAGRDNIKRSKEDLKKHRLLLRHHVFSIMRRERLEKREKAYFYSKK